MRIISTKFHVRFFLTGKTIKSQHIQQSYKTHRTDACLKTKKKFVFMFFFLQNESKYLNVERQKRIYREDEDEQQEQDQEEM